MSAEDDKAFWERKAAEDKFFADKKEADEKFFASKQAEQKAFEERQVAEAKFLADKKAEEARFAENRLAEQKAFEDKQKAAQQAENLKQIPQPKDFDTRAFGVAGALVATAVVATQVQRFIGLQVVNDKLCAVFHDGRNVVYATEKEVDRVLASTAATAQNPQAPEAAKQAAVTAPLVQARETFDLARQQELGPGSVIGLKEGEKVGFARPRQLEGLLLDSEAHYNDTFLHLTQNAQGNVPLIATREKVMIAQMTLGYQVPFVAARLPMGAVLTPLALGQPDDSPTAEAARTFAMDEGAIRQREQREEEAFVLGANAQRYQNELWQNSLPVPVRQHLQQRLNGQLPDTAPVGMDSGQTPAATLPAQRPRPRPAATYPVPELKPRPRKKQDESK